MKLLYVLVAILATTVAKDTNETKSAKEEPQALPSATKQNPEVPVGASITKRGIVKDTNQPPSRYYFSQSNYVPPQNTYAPTQNTYVPPQNTYIPTQNTYVSPQNNYVSPTNNYITTQKPYITTLNPYFNTQNPYITTQKPFITTQKPYDATHKPYDNTQKPYVPTQNYYWTTKAPYVHTQATYTTTKPPQYTSSSQQNQNQWTPTNWGTATTPVSVIKNEHYMGNNGSYRYEYQLTDGTHVGEEGYVVNPNTKDQSFVKKGWYSYVGTDGYTHSVTYWADHTGYHASYKRYHQ